MYARTVASSVIILLLGISAVWAMTGEFMVITIEQARRLEVFLNQPMVPNVLLVNQDRQMLGLQEWLKDGNKIVIADFIYTNCQSLCRSLGSEFQQLQKAIAERGIQDRIHLLSVSFDPEHDQPSVLKQYSVHLQARPDIWTFATVHKSEELSSLLRFFGVTVIPDKLGGFQHNAALMWISPSGKFYRITDYEAKASLELIDALAMREGAKE